MTSPLTLGRLSNPDLTQRILVKKDGRLRFAAITPPSPLPPELVAEIFLHCLDRKPVTPHVNTAPLVLSRVCRRWRAIALCTPELWSYLVVPIHPSEDEIAMYQMWLSRACRTPLSLRLEDGGDIRYLLQPLYPLDTFTQTVIGMSRQWRSLDIDANPRTVASILRSLAGKLPLLKTLTVSDLPAKKDGFTLSLSDASQLRHVSFSGDSSGIQLPQNLTTLNLDVVNLLSCLAVLRNSPSLLNASFLIAGALSTLPTLILRHDRVESLSFLGGNYPNPADPFSILNCLQTPALKSLALGFLGRVPVNDGIPIPFFAFLSRSQVQLHTLTLSRIPTTTRTLIQILKASPSLVHFTFEPCAWMDMTPFFAQFKGHRDFLPALNFFHLFFSEFKPSGHRSRTSEAFTASTVVDMLSWRWTSADTRLQRFEIRYNRHETPSFDKAINSHPEFQRLKDEGMALYVGRERPFINWAVR
ncbi:hypothetical protein C8R46DRAFT_1257594 [Mycena filopes]|nr:hypothetical protein C8R46DRAFT_1257594 [Mycena filopes]